MSSIEWSTAFDALESILPLQWERISPVKWRSPLKMDGTKPAAENPEKTAAFLNGKGVQIFEFGENPLSLIDAVQTVYNVHTYGEAADIIKAKAGIVDTFTSSSTKAPQNGKERALPSPVKVSPKATPAPIQTEIPSDPEELAAMLKDAECILLEEGFSGTVKEYIEEARSLYYSNEWKALSSLWTGTHKGYPSLFMQWTGADGKKGGFYHIDPLLLTEKKRGSRRRMKPRSERAGAPKGWLKGHGASQTGTTGGAVRIAPPSSGVIGICEGLEDALSIMQAEGYFPSVLGFPLSRDREQLFYEEKLRGEDPFPVWPTLGKNALLQFIPPEEVREVYIFPDRGNSKKWEKELLLLVKRITDSGRKCTPVYPPDGCKDWNEYIQKRLGYITPPASPNA